MKKIMLLILTIYCSTSYAATMHSRIPNITGTYLCIITEPRSTMSQKSKSFVGKVIIKKQHNAYVVTNDTNAGKLRPWVQFGVLTNHTFSIAYKSTTNSAFGVQVYHVSQAGNILAGPYVYWKKFKQKGMESCIKVHN